MINKQFYWNLQWPQLSSFFSLLALADHPPGHPGVHPDHPLLLPDLRGAQAGQAQGQVRRQGHRRRQEVKGREAQQVRYHLQVGVMVQWFLIFLPMYVMFLFFKLQLQTVLIPLYLSKTNDVFTCMRLVTQLLNASSKLHLYPSPLVQHRRRARRPGQRPLGRPGGGRRRGQHEAHLRAGEEWWGCVGNQSSRDTSKFRNSKSTQSSFLSLF